MKRLENKLSVLIGILLIVPGITILLKQFRFQRYNKYVLFVGAIFVIITIISLFIKEKEETYKEKLERIFKNNKNSLIRIKEIPALDGLNIIRMDSLKDILDAKKKIKKAIYYKEEKDSCCFMIINHKDVCLYIDKKDSNVVNPVERLIKLTEKKNGLDHVLLEDIEKTTIIKLDNLKSYRVSPVKEEEEKKNAKKSSGDEFFERLNQKEILRKLSELALMQLAIDNNDNNKNK